ncbi:MAG TPA: hypothetical protein VII33_02480 [Nakamurella sp.]
MAPSDRAIRSAKWASGSIWVWSWYTMYLEIFRWKHVTGTLRFNAGPPVPGTGIRPRPGRPLVFLYVCSAAAPVIFVAAAFAERRRRLRYVPVAGRPA